MAELEQGATDRGSSGGMIYQRSALSSPWQRSPPTSVQSTPTPPLCFYLTDQLTSRQPKKKPWEPLYTECHR